MPGFELGNDPHWCPPERIALKNFYESAKGQEWTNAALWVDEYENHCSWYGVLCDDGGKVISLTLNNSGLSGRISTSIGELKSLEILDLHENDLQGSIPSQVGELTLLLRARFSYNALTGCIPGELMNLTNLSLLHLHGNRLVGNANFSFSGTSHSALVADCGSPSDFESPLDCPNCTMCCNSIGECHPRSNTAASNGALSYTNVAFIVIASVAVFSCVVAFVLRNIMKKRRNPPTCSPADEPTYELPKIAWEAIGKESVYCFLLTDSCSGWMVSIATMFGQAATFFLFIEAAELDFGDDRKDWVYSWRCPRNSDSCEDTKHDLLYGWIVFVVLMAVHTMPDLINGLKLLWISAVENDQKKDEKESFWKNFWCFLSGLSLVLIVVLALCASVVYSIATARSNTALMTNAVVVLFVNDLDEQLFALLGVVLPNWLGGLSIPQTECNGACNHKFQEQEKKFQEHENDFQKQNVKNYRLRKDFEQKYQQQKIEIDKLKEALEQIERRLVSSNESKGGG